MLLSVSCPPVVVDRSHGAVWNWTRDLADDQADPPTAAPRVVVDEKQTDVNGEEMWLFAAFDTGWIEITAHYKISVLEKPDRDEYHEFEQLDGQKIQRPDSYPIQTM